MTDGDCVSALVVVMLLCTGSAKSETVAYHLCADQHSLDLRNVLIESLDQAKLAKPGPAACADHCIDLDRSYIGPNGRLFVHIPASGSFANRLVCGCGFSEALHLADVQPDASCNLPCPRGINDTVDAVRLNGGGKPLPGVLQISSNPERAGNARAIGLVSGGTPMGKAPVRSKGKSSHRSDTCGDGRGLLSVYHFSGAAASRTFSDDRSAAPSHFRSASSPLIACLLFLMSLDGLTNGLRYLVKR